MTDDELQAIEARAEAATLGPWEADAHEPDDVVVWARTPEGDPREGDGLLVTNVGHSRVGQCGVAFDSHAADAAFIAHARQDVPNLCKEIRRLREMLRDK